MRYPTATSGLLAISLVVSGCAGLSDTQQRTLTGAAAGSAGGALIGGLADNAAVGAALGGVAGAAGGYLYDRQQRAED